MMSKKIQLFIPLFIHSNKSLLSMLCARHLTSHAVLNKPAESVHREPGSSSPVLPGDEGLYVSCYLQKGV